MSSFGLFGTYALIAITCIAGFNNFYMNPMTFIVTVLIFVFYIW